MSLRFAASRTGQDAVIARMLAPVRPTRAANDNGRPLGALMGDPHVLRQTLMHFARHGLSAANKARDEAEQALLAGEEDRYRRWLVVCKQLDRRMAQRLEKQRG